MRRAIVVATCAVASVLAQPLDAQWSVETSNGRRSAVSDEASPGGTGEFAGAGLGGMAQVIVVCGVSHSAAPVVFAAPFDPPAGTTSVEVRVDEWTHRLDFVMSDNVMMLAGSSSSGLVDRIRSGSQLDMRLGSADADHITWSWSLARSQSAIGTACGNPARARPCCRVCRTGKACGDSMHQPPLHLSPPAGLRLQRSIAGSGTGACTGELDGGTAAALPAASSLSLHGHFMGEHCRMSKKARLGCGCFGLGAMFRRGGACRQRSRRQLPHRRTRCATARCADEARLLSRLQHGQSLRQFVHQPQLHLSQGEGVRLQRERARNTESEMTIERHRASGHRGPGERLG